MSLDISPRRLQVGDWGLLRDLRLMALADAPDAFASTLEREAAFDEARWRRRLRGENPVFVVEGAGGPGVEGMAGGFRHRAELDHADEWELVSMWVAGVARGTGVAGVLIDAVIEWARTDGADRLGLWVTAGNEAACHRYRQHGFRPTGERQPLPGRPGLEELRMSLTL